MRKPLVDLPRRVVGWLLLTIGLLAGSIGYQAYMIRKLVLDPNIVVDATDHILERRIVQSAIADQIVAAEEAQLLKPGTVSSADLHVHDDLRQAAIDVIRTQQFHDVYATAIRSLHNYVFEHHTTPPVIDLTPLVPKLREAAIAMNPAYANLLPPQGTLRSPMTTSSAPDLTGVRHRLDHNLARLAGIALLFVGAAFLVHSRRPTVLRRLGFWLVGFALLQVALALLLPVIASGLPGDASIVAEHVARTLMPRLFAPAGALFLFGVGALISARRWQRMHDQRHERQGADAFLDPDRMIKVATLAGPRAEAPVAASVAARSDVRSATATDTPAAVPVLDTRAVRSPAPPIPVGYAEPRPGRRAAVDFPPAPTGSPVAAPVGAPTLTRTVFDLSELPTRHPNGQ